MPFLNVGERPCNCNHFVVPFMRAFWASLTLSQLNPSAWRGSVKGDPSGFRGTY